ncbi:uncharacterized protein LOC112137216 isoform X2 [Oryzias melastigma]|uniref:uncharacterized protein LOC112137216 isoform X2 n=1 Tax=Oryzias melastigma TaxID=30732 RepID=UPI000CF7F389|nr:uncharacterized protein LOC112137216 isoform X2 [Oryzias melastigma]
MSTAEICEAFERIIEGMEWEDIVSTLMEIIEAELGTATPPPLSLAGSQSLPDVAWCPPLAAGSTQMKRREANVPFITFYPIYFLLAPPTAEEVYQLSPAAPLSSSSSAKKQDDHVKQPPNASMIFSREQKAKVKAELNIKSSSALKCTTLSPQEKEKHFKQEFQNEQEHPGRSSAHNCVKKRKRASASASDEESAPGENNSDSVSPAP